MAALNMNEQKPNYGLDAPKVVQRLLLVGALMLLCGIAAILVRNRIPLAVWFAGPFFGGPAGFFITGMVMIWGSTIGKLRLRDRLIASMRWRGDECVLDVGCGHGLMLLAAAKRLTTGKAIGVDIWQTEDQAGNNRAATLRNARLEGVEGRVELRDGDARQLPFEDQTFDAVLSSWALHNIYDAAGRRQALEEIVRVLKAEGQLVLADIRHATEYAAVLTELRLLEVKLGGPSFIFVFPTRWVIGHKPGRRA